MGLIVRHSDGSDFIVIPDKTYDEVSTSLKLPGRGVYNWGEAYLNDFIKLLEHFAAPFEPRSPQVGQLWYNTGTGELLLYTTNKEWQVVNKDIKIEDELNKIYEELRNNNASYDEPIEKEKGLTWYDLNTNTFKIWDGERWQSINRSIVSSFTQPIETKEGDLWFDKNINELKVYDGKEYVILNKIYEGTTAPDSDYSYFWINSSNKNVYVKKVDGENEEWVELGNNIEKVDVLPSKSNNKFVLLNSEYGEILYVNKGSFEDPIWVEIPEFSGAYVSPVEPKRVVEGMFWLDGEQRLWIRKKDKWVEINETAISYVSDEQPEKAKDGFLWFDTEDGKLKLKYGNKWLNVKSDGIIAYGTEPKPEIGKLWYDVVNKKLKIYDGSNWVVIKNSSVITSYIAPENPSDGQLWLDTTSGELKVYKNGKWAVLTEYARALTYVPSNPKEGDLIYVDNKLKVYQNGNWTDINPVINTVAGDDITIDYDPVSHELVIIENGVVKRVPLAVNRQVIVENVGITSDVIEVIKPDIKEKERRIIKIEKINLKQPFFVFRNGMFYDNYEVDLNANDLILKEADPKDEIDIIQLISDTYTNYLKLKFLAKNDGTFVIDNYTLTEEEQEIYDQVMAEYNSKLAEFLSKHGDNATINDLTENELAILDEIKSKIPKKQSNNIADLSSGSIIVLKNGVFVSDSELSINPNNENKIYISNVKKGDEIIILQIKTGHDYISAFFSKEYSFTIDSVVDNTEQSYQVEGMVMKDTIGSQNNTTIDDLGKVKVNYTYDKNTKKVTFDLLDIDTNYFFMIIRNNLFVSPVKYEIDKDNNTCSIYANDGDDIKIVQYYLPHKFVPVEFNYVDFVVKEDTAFYSCELSSDFDINKPLLVYRNGVLQENSNVNVITSESVTDENGVTYTVSGLRKLQIFPDANNISTNLLAGDVITIMQVSQPEVFNIIKKEFNAKNDGVNIFDCNGLKKDVSALVYRNGLKLNDDEYEIDDNKLTVHNCNGVTEEDLAKDPNAKGDIIVVHQFYSEDETEVLMTEEKLVSDVDGSEDFILNKTNFVKKEFLVVFKNGQMIVRRMPESLNTTFTQINTFDVYIKRVYASSHVALDPNGNVIYDSKGDPIIIVDDPNDYQDITYFNIDNLVKGEIIEVLEFDKVISEVTNLKYNYHYEILPENNIQRIYTTKFDQLSEMTMVFQDGLLIDRYVDKDGNDLYKVGDMTRVYDQYAVDNNTKSIIINDWKIGGKLRVHQFTSSERDVVTKTLRVVIVNDGTYDVFLPNNEKYVPNMGQLEVYVDRVLQLSGIDYQEVADNRILFNKALNKNQEVVIILRKYI
jgi:hypothetical protein